MFQQCLTFARYVIGVCRIITIVYNLFICFYLLLMWHTHSLCFFFFIVIFLFIFSCRFCFVFTISSFFCHVFVYKIQHLLSSWCKHAYILLHSVEGWIDQKGCCSGLWKKMWNQSSYTREIGNLIFESCLKFLVRLIIIC